MGSKSEGTIGPVARVKDDNLKMPGQY
jgi:hypothetical protein